MKRYFVLILFLGYLSSNCQAQYDARWVLGTYGQLYFNDTSSINPIVENGRFNTITATNNASVCKYETGEILIYSHGSIIYNNLGLPMENGDSINNGKYTFNSYPAGPIIWQGVIILPFPNHKNLFYVIYNNLDSIIPGMYISSKLYYSVVNLNINNGLGKVVQKDISILNNWLEGGRINAIQHANGRDWWILVNGNNDTKHYVFLLDPAGIKLYKIQTIGSVYTATIQSNNPTCVNQSGTQIVYTYGTRDAGHHHRFDFYDFDRCSGMLSNYYYKSFIDTAEAIGCAFSPNDSLFYVSNLYHLFQFNIKDKADSNRILIDSFDITVHDPLNVFLGLQKLAPDNKIYMGTWNGSRQLHCITKPNIRGKGCGFKQSYLKTDSSNHYFQGSMPNYPNFRLGVLKGSSCDTIKESLPLPVTDRLLIYPNPNNGSFKIVNGTSNINNVAVYNVLGQLVFKQNYNAALVAEINVNHFPKAMYILIVENTDGINSRAKFLKQ